MKTYEDLPKYFCYGSSKEQLHDSAHDKLPVNTQSDGFTNNTVATPRVANVTEALSLSVPERYAVVMVRLIVTLPEVLLKIDTASPAENTSFGTSIAPLVLTVTNSPISVIANV